MASTSSSDHGELPAVVADSSETSASLRSRLASSHRAAEANEAPVEPEVNTDPLKLTDLTKEHLNVVLSGYLMTKARTEAAKECMEVWARPLVPSEDAALSTEQQKYLMLFLHNVNKGMSAGAAKEAPGTTSPLSLLKKHQLLLVQPKVLDAVARSFVFARDSLSMKSDIPRLLFDSLNMLVAAEREGTDTMCDLFWDSDMASTSQGRVLLRRFFKGDYGRNYPVLRMYPPRDPGTTFWLQVGVALMIVTYIVIYATKKYDASYLPW